MHVVRRTTTVLTAALLGAGLLGMPSSAAVRQAPTVELEPARLSRGPDIAIAHVDGDDLVVGERRVDLPGTSAWLLGASGDAYVVRVVREDGSRARILRVEPDDTLTTLVSDATEAEALLSEDGDRLLTTTYGARGASTIKVLSATTGERLVRRSFGGYPSVLAAKGDRVLLSTERRGIFWWSTGSGRLRTVTMRVAGRASITHDLLSSYSEDPYLGGCTLLTRLSRPGRTLWTSCRERVDAFSPDGSQILTVHLLSDGIGPRTVAHREIDGTRLATYDSTGWFTTFRWESPSTLLLETHGRRKTATVRCTLSDCENATDPVRTDPQLG